MRKVVVRPQAQLDVEEAATWYEAKQSSLGLGFLVEFEYVIRRICVAPSEFPEIHPTVRRGLLRRFPYAVYFLVQEQQVAVIAVLH